MNTDGSGFMNLHNFLDQGDGGFPEAEPLVVDGTVYVAALSGTYQEALGKFGTNGGPYTILHNFAPSTSITNTDGENLYNPLILQSNTLYGVALSGGPAGVGVLFSINTDGSGFTNLHSFLGQANGDGANPGGRLLLRNNMLYGMTGGGGAFNRGTVYVIHCDGTGYTNLYNFGPFPVPCAPRKGLVLDNYTFYGTLTSGGNSNSGAIFSLSFAPQLAITNSGANTVLSWPTNVAGFDYSGFVVQSASNLTAPVSWTTLTNTSSIVNGQNNITLPGTATPVFFRLSN